MVTQLKANATSAEKLAHYRELAEAYQEKHKCRWSEATLAVKRKYPESCEVFGAPVDRRNRRS